MSLLPFLRQSNVPVDPLLVAMLPAMEPGIYIYSFFLADPGKFAGRKSEILKRLDKEQMLTAK